MKRNLKSISIIMSIMLASTLACFPSYTLAEDDMEVAYTNDFTLPGATADDWTTRTTIDGALTEMTIVEGASGGLSQGTTGRAMFAQNLGSKYEVSGTYSYHGNSVIMAFNSVISIDSSTNVMSTTTGYYIRAEATQTTLGHKPNSWTSEPIKTWTHNDPSYKVTYATFDFVLSYDNGIVDYKLTNVDAEETYDFHYDLTEEGAKPLSYVSGFFGIGCEYASGFKLKNITIKKPSLGITVPSKANYDMGEPIELSFGAPVTSIELASKLELTELSGAVLNYTPSIAMSNDDKTANITYSDLLGGCGYILKIKAGLASTTGLSLSKGIDFPFNVNADRMVVHYTMDFTAAGASAEGWLTSTKIDGAIVPMPVIEGKGLEGRDRDNTFAFYDDNLGTEYEVSGTCYRADNGVFFFFNSTPVLRPDDSYRTTGYQLRAESAKLTFLNKYSVDLGGTELGNITLDPTIVGYADADFVLKYNNGVVVFTLTQGTATNTFTYDLNTDGAIAYPSGSFGIASQASSLLQIRNIQIKKPTDYFLSGLVTTTEEDNKIGYSVNANNFSGTPLVDSKVILALYDEDNKMLGCDIKNVENLSGTASFTGSVEYGAGEVPKYIKAYFWEDLDNIEPLSNKIEAFININNG